MIRSRLDKLWYFPARREEAWAWNSFDVEWPHISEWQALPHLFAHKWKWHTYSFLFYCYFKRSFCNFLFALFAIWAHLPVEVAENNRNWEIPNGFLQFLVWWYVFFSFFRPTICSPKLDFKCQWDFSELGMEQSSEHRRSSGHFLQCGVQEMWSWWF